MTLVALLLVAGGGAAFTAWALPRGGRSARIGLVAGIAALGLVAALAAASGTASPASAGGGSGDAPWNGSLVPNGYLRLVLVLWAVEAVVIAGIAWLLRGMAAMRGLLPATLAGLAGATVTLAAASPVLGALGAAGTGLAAIPVLLATQRPATAGTAAREIRISVATAAALLAVIAVVPIAARLVLADPGGAGAGRGSAPEVAAGIALLAVAFVLAARAGIIPYHVRVAALSDAATPGTLPLLIAWLPLPFAAVALGIVVDQIAPLALPLGGERTLILVLVLLTLVAAAMAAFIQDDLRHATGYLVIADAGLVLLAIAAVDPAAWGPARTWLVVMAASKTALGAWSAVVEDRFETRSIPDLRGWMRSAPLLAAGLVAIVVATFGLPGWVALEARGTLASLAAGSPWSALLVLAGFLTLPTYLRLLGLGLGPATSHVERAVPERIVRAWRPGPSRRSSRAPVGSGLPVEQEGPPATEGTAARTAATRNARPGTMRAGTERGSSTVTDRGPAAGRGAATGRLVSGAGTHLRRNRVELLSAGVLALALVGALVAWGAMDVASAAAAPAPAAAGLIEGGG